MASFFDTLLGWINSFFELALGWALSLGPVYSLIVISFILTLLSTLAQKYLTDQKELKRLKDESKEINKKIRENKNDPQKLCELQSEAMKRAGQQLKQSFKPLIYTFVPLLLVFIWLRGKFTGVEVGLLGFINSWLL